MTCDGIQVWVGIAGVIVAAVAVFISVRAEMRNQTRWQNDMDRQERIATASAKPLLTITGIEYENRKGLRLVNDGIGPALVTSIEISRDNRTPDNVPELLDLPRPVVWDTFRRFKPPFEPVAPGQERLVILLTSEGLANAATQGRSISTAEIDEIMGKLQQELNVVQIRITYTDIFGNTQPDCARNI